MNSTTPSEVTELIRGFCTEVSPGHDPVYVPVRTIANAERGNCYGNVAKKIEAEGGTIEHGWVLWLDPRWLLEAEHHAVWLSPSGERLDVSPHTETRVLFLPDPDRKYVVGKPFANRRKALFDDPDLIRAAALFDQAEAKMLFDFKNNMRLLTPEARRLQAQAGLILWKKGVVTMTDVEEDMKAFEHDKFKVIPLTPRQLAEKRKKQRKAEKKKR